ncbi:LicD family protein [Bifidobacterium sp. ESL0682]|uniref:LicD family protein n=1 Tax=Bifidobacterium sp. ESL0682 TaxID=2983212 RepID=UPI0023F90429|nr:LicD family protein [Bifidobacterium sp. ESL0682]WEV42232.1 LicD family protein [Bifidobacterium sp. ESL0682]
MGTFIDVYPLDGVGNDSEAAEKQKKMVDNLTKQYLRAADFDIYNKNSSAIKKSLKRIRAFFLKSPEYYWQKIMQQSSEKQYEDSRFISCQVWIPVFTRFHKKEDYGTGQITEFEGLQVRIPNNPDAILQSQYGDYMRLPPKEERISHHFYSIVPRA